MLGVVDNVLDEAMAPVLRDLESAGIATLQKPEPVNRQVEARRSSEIRLS